MATFMGSNETTIKFHEACIDENLKTIKGLLKNKENINVRQLDQMGTLLRIVSLAKTFPSLEKLKEAMEKHPGEEVVKVLCEIGVDLHQKDSYGKTSLHLVCHGTKGTFGSTHKFHANPRIVEILLEHGASVHAKDDFGHTPLHDACARSGNLEIVQTLIQNNADVHATHEAQGTPLHAASWGGNLEIVQELLKYKPNVNAITKSEKKMTPLMCAVQIGSIEIVEELLKHGADTNFSDPKYGSALHLAMNNESITKTLLKNRCNTKFRAKLNFDDVELPDCTALELALDNESINIVKIIAFHETY